MKVGKALVGISLLAATLSWSRATNTANTKQSATGAVATVSTELSEGLSEGLSEQVFSGITMTVTRLKYPIGNAFESHKAAFEKATGANIVLETVPFGDL